MSAPTPAYVRHATYLDNHDGDTVTLALDHGKYPTSKAVTEAELRIRGLWCPELSEPGGIEAATHLRSLMVGAAWITCQTYKGSFGRTIADVWVDGRPLAELMIAAGHGKGTR